MYGDATMNDLGAASFEQIKQDVPISTDRATQAYVQCVADQITAVLTADDGAPPTWEVVVFQDESANAFALPGGKIGVHTGLLAVAQDQDQLATVIGHEIGHVLANHSNERMTQQQLVGAGMLAANAIASREGMSDTELYALGALGLGMQYGVLLPYSRAHESEADLIGLDLMARAGFDPEASVLLWQNMGRGGAQPPEWMSTHPSHGTRIYDLSQRMPRAHEIEAQAHAANRRPSCRR